MSLLEVILNKAVWEKGKSPELLVKLLAHACKTFKS